MYVSKYSIFDFLGGDNVDVGLIKKRVNRFIPVQLKNYYRKARKKLLHTPNEVQHSMVDENWVLFHIVGENVLDCGCGIGRWGYLIKKAMPEKFVVGIDIDKKYLVPLKKRKYYDFLVQGDIAYLPFAPKSFDTVLAIEVVEHQTRNLGMAFLTYIDEISKTKTILTTPSGFFDTHLKGFEGHRSGWCKRELEKMGYKVTEYGWKRYKWLFATKNNAPSSTSCV
jgi:SAM-dependent methyltransferase